MKIAIVAPSPVPFLIGGAENLLTGWVAALNAKPCVEAELIKLPSPERDFWEIIDSYRRFAELDVSHFDRVISAKYPAWMVRHPDHHLFMLHKLRGLYDTWPPGLETRARETSPEVERLLLSVDRSCGARTALPEIFAALDELRSVAPSLNPELFALPGALIRAVVHALDDIALAPEAIRRYTAISETVAVRRDYFPSSIASQQALEVIHPPAPVRELPSTPCSATPEGAIFSASRLDGPKRMDWVIQAYRASGLEVPLVVAGDGPERNRLESLGADQPGVRLVGRLTDSELADAYRRASFVVFVPEKEDYGLVALEALQAGTPVLTCTDAGGVTELVRDGENGLVVSPDFESLAGGMRRLQLDEALRSRLASRAASSVAHIGWPSMAEAFSQPWLRVAVINTFCVYPPLNGGQLRMLQLYRQLSRFADVRMVNLASAGSNAEQRQLWPGLVEQRVPMSEAHANFEHALMRELRAPCTDVAAMLRPDLTPPWLEAIDMAAHWADLVVASHPYTYPAIRRVWSGPVVYESHNVEADLKEAIFGHAKTQLAAVKKVEGDCARQAPLVTVCSDEDAKRIQALYGLERQPEVVPNGVDAASYPKLDSAQRKKLRQRLGLGKMSLALFVGSLHGPNMDAVRTLMRLAPKCPDVGFCVLGSVGEASDLPAPPANLKLVGRVTDAELRVWLAAADIGLNPVASGSGTNLKMLEYAAADLPILSTPFGARGGVLTPNEHFLQAELTDFPAAIRAILDNAREARDRAAQARVQAAEAGDWTRIARGYYRAMVKVTSKTGA